MSAHKGNILLPLISAVAIVALFAAGYFFWQNQQLQKGSSNNMPSPSPALTPTPTPDSAKASPGKQDETANWETYTNSELGFSFRYPTENSLQISELNVSNDSTALKPDKELWAVYPGTDVIIVSLYLYKSNLPAQEWWNTKGIIKYNQLVTDFYNAVNPKPPTVKLPNFTVSTSSVGGQTAIIARGNVEAAQRGDSVISIVNNDGWIYMFEQLNPLPNNKALEISNQILSTFHFLK